MLAAAVAIGGIAAFSGIALALIARQFSNDETASVSEQINSLLPQTQCGQCNFPGCRPYAQAIAGGEAQINQCPPGGQATIDAIALLLGEHSQALNPDNGIEKPDRVVIIREEICIGCKKCILACPVDAIVGATKKMHTVITDECTGCELCIDPCPVDCIDIVPIAVTPSNWVHPFPGRVFNSASSEA